MARILISEDEDALCAICARALQAPATRSRPHATAATRSICSARRGPFRPPLADIRMPIMDGIALSLVAARDYPDLTILLMTGYADQRERACGLDAIIHDVIQKPFTLAALRGAVDEALTVKAR